MNKYCVCIPSYKYRYEELLNNLNNFSKDFDVRIFLSEEDTELDKYYAHKYDDNIDWVVTPCKNIREKRKFIFLYAIEHGYDGIFEFDDDIRFKCRKITPETKRETSDSYKPIDCDINETMHKMIEKCIEHNAAFCSVNQEWCIGWGQPDVVSVNTKLNSARFVFLNVAMIKDSPCMYDDKSIVPEDTDFMLQLLSNGYKCITLSDYTYSDQIISTSYRINHLVSTVSSDEYFKGREFIGMFLKWKIINLFVDKTNNLKMRIYCKSFINKKDFAFKDDEYTKGLIEVCQTYDVPKVIEYIKTHK